MILDSTFYPNISRTVISGGSGLIFPTDVILFCDTTTGAISLTLLEIPSLSWNTVYKIYVVDSGNNASVNNVTINAPVGYLVNGLPFVTINTNGDTFIITIANDTNYLSVSNYNSGGSTANSVSVINQQNPFALPVTLTTNLDQIQVNGLNVFSSGVDQVTLQNAYVEVTTLQVGSLFTTNSFIPNQWYCITDVRYGNFPDKIKAYVPAVTNSRISNIGHAEFFNADYDKNGIYSGVVGFAGQLGLWTNALAVVVGNVVIDYNLHYVNLTGVNGGLRPSNDAVNWQVLPYVVGNGYIKDYNTVVVNYDPKALDFYIAKRIDLQQNEVDFYSDKFGRVSFTYFPFGNSLFRYNRIFQSVADVANVEMQNVFERNNFLSCEVTFIDPDGTFKATNIQDNYFSNTLRPLRFEKGDTLFYMRDNVFISSEGTSILTNGTFDRNNFQFCDITFVVSGNTVIQYNQGFRSSLSIIKTAGSFTDNTVTNGNFSVSAGTGNEIGNEITDSATVNIQNNLGDFFFNKVSQVSSFNITFIDVAVKVKYFDIVNYADVKVQNFYADAGISIKSNGVTIRGGVFDVINFDGEIYAVTFEYTELQITDWTGAIIDSSFRAETDISITDMNNKVIQSIDVQARDFVIGTMDQSLVGGQAVRGNCTIKITIDCSDPLIYDLPTQTLTIPSGYQQWIGIISLQNANGLTIAKIVDPPVLTSFIINQDVVGSGVVNFVKTPVGLAVNEDIVGDASVPPIMSLTFRISGNDFIQFKRDNLFNQVLIENIYT